MKKKRQAKKTWSRVWAAMLTVVALPLVIWALEQFVTYDWGQGVLRSVLVLAIALFCVVLFHIAPRLRRGANPPTVLGVLLVGAALVFCGINIQTGVRSISETTDESELFLDQGQISYRSLRLLSEGRNPWSETAVLDFMVLDRLWLSLGFKWRDCLEQDDAELGSPEDQMVRYSEDFPTYWETLDADLMPHLLPRVTDDPDCEHFHLQSRAMGAKYGPTLFALYAPAVSFWGKRGITITHLLFFIAMCVLLGWIAVQSGNKSWAAVAIPLLVFVVPSHVRHNTLSGTTHDVIATFFAFVGLALLFGKKVRANLGAVAIGVSISIKLMPGLFFVPLLLGRPKRSWLYCALPLVVAYTPPMIWEWRGFLNNVILFYFFIFGGDDTGIAFYLSPLLAKVLKVVGLAVILGALVWFRKKSWTFTNALQYLVIAHAAFLAVGNYFHNNYLVWFLPLVGLLLMCSLVGDRSRKVPDS